MSFGHPPKPRPASFKDGLGVLLRGLCMGAADIIPGISGGTVAFITGIYKDLLDSIKSFNFSALKRLCRGQFRFFFQSVSWEFLLILFCGMGTGLVLMAHFFQYLLNHPIYHVYLYGGFIGLILASAVFCAKQITRWKWSYGIALVIGGACAFFLSGLDVKQNVTEPTYDVPLSSDQVPNRYGVELTNYNRDTGTLMNVPASSLGALLAKGTIDANTVVFSHDSHQSGKASEFEDPYMKMGLNSALIAAGAVAICAMLLPGISGSYLLNVMGFYGVAISALVHFTGGLKNGIFDVDSFFVLLSIGLGILVGLVIFSRVVSWLLNHYHNLTIALLTGFMIGALRSIWPFWNYEYSINPLRIDGGPQLHLLHPQLPNWGDPSLWITAFFMVVGFSLVLLLEQIALSKKTTEP